MRGKKAMSIFASILRAVYRLSGVKKSFTLPENELRKEIEKQNRHRGVFTPTDHGTESAGHLLVLVLGLVLLREKAKYGECKEAVQ